MHAMRAATRRSSLREAQPTAGCTALRASVQRSSDATSSARQGGSGARARRRGSTWRYHHLPPRPWTPSLPLPPTWSADPEERQRRPDRLLWVVLRVLLWVLLRVPPPAGHQRAKERLGGAFWKAAASGDVPTLQKCLDQYEQPIDQPRPAPVSRMSASHSRL